MQYTHTRLIFSVAIVTAAAPLAAASNPHATTAASAAAQSAPQPSSNSQPASAAASTALVVRGATIGSFTSVSLRPPIISFSLHRPSGMDAHLASATHCEVSMLARAQADVAALFADARRASEQVPRVWLSL